MLMTCRLETMYGSQKGVLIYTLSFGLVWFVFSCANLHMEEENIYNDTSVDLAKLRGFSSLIIHNFVLPCLALPYG